MKSFSRRDVLASGTLAGLAGVSQLASARSAADTDAEMAQREQGEKEITVQRQKLVQAAWAVITTVGGSDDIDVTSELASGGTTTETWAGKSKR